MKALQYLYCAGMIGLTAYMGWVMASAVANGYG